jgi:hypothetical protein
LDVQANSAESVQADTVWNDQIGHGESLYVIIANR